jgi:Flp pilus assembly protein TadD
MLPALLELHVDVLAREGDYGKAIVELEKLRKLVPKNIQFLTQLGILYYANKQPRKAIERFSDAITIDPKQSTALRSRADAYLSTGQHAEAAADYESALKLKPDDDGILNNLAWVLATSPDDAVRNSKRAIELATKAAELTGYSKPHILSTLAASYAESGDFETAKKWSQKAVERGAEDADTDDDTRSQLKQELASYESKKPWREKQVIEEQDDDSQPAQDKETSALKPPPPPDSDSKASTSDASPKKD